LSNQITALSGQFKKLTDNINRAAQKTQQTTGFFGSLPQISSTFHGRVEAITIQFGKWTSLVGSVVMLASGGGFWSLNRLSQTIVERQRQMLGIGGPWAAERGRATRNRSSLAPSLGFAAISGTPRIENGDAFAAATSIWITAVPKKPIRYANLFWKEKWGIKCKPVMLWARKMPQTLTPKSAQLASRASVRAESLEERLRKQLHTL
jgi:hypothetical protein